MKALRPLIRFILAESRSIHYSKLVKDDISYLFQSDGTIHAVSLYADDGWDLLGKMDAHVYSMKRISQVPSTYESILALGGNENSVVIGVYDARIPDTKNRGKGFGRVMYEALLHEAFLAHGEFFFAPMSATGAGTTTTDARRVWSSLSREFPIQGDVIHIDRLPPVMGVMPTKKNASI